MTMKLLLLLLISAQCIFVSTIRPTSHAIDYSDSLIQLSLTKDVKQLTVLAKKIMVELGINQRTNTKMDDSITSMALIIPNGHLAIFLAEKTIFPNNDTISRYYLKPRLIVNLQVDSILKVDEAKPTPIYVYANSAVVHELTHYLQATIELNPKQDTTSFRDIRNRRRYMSTPREFEAYSVGFYYLLFYTNRSRLQDIMDTNIQSKRKMKMLINVADSMLYPNSEPIFPEEVY
jgi:hypothetical protein